MAPKGNMKANPITEGIIREAIERRHIAFSMAFQGMEPEDCLRFVKNSIVKLISVEVGPINDQIITDLLGFYQNTAWRISNNSKVKKSISSVSGYMEGLIEMHDASLKLSGSIHMLRVILERFEKHLFDYLYQATSLEEVFVKLVSISTRYVTIDDFYKTIIRDFSEKLFHPSVCDDILNRISSIEHGECNSLYPYAVERVSIARVKSAGFQVLLQEALVRVQNIKAIQSF